MARRSAASLSISRPPSVGERPEPPAGLTAPEAELWRKVVDGKPADWWGEDNLPLLAEYCRAVCTCEVLAGRLAEATGREGTPDAELGRLLNWRHREAERAARLATKLRLTQQSRYGARSAARQAGRAAGGSAGGGKRPWE
jgi:hypothetical protein